MRTSNEIRKNIRSLERRIERLAKKQNSTSVEFEATYQERFEKMSTYMGGGTYQWCGVFSTDTRELFLLGVLVYEGQPFKNNYDK